MRQCPTCKRIFPKSLGRGDYCSVGCAAAEVRLARATLRLRRLVDWVKRS